MSTHERGQNKIKYFYEPEIKQKFPDPTLKIKLIAENKVAQEVLENTCQILLGNRKSHNYQEIVKNLVSSFRSVGRNMPLKLHFLKWTFFQII